MIIHFTHLPFSCTVVSVWGSLLGEHNIRREWSYLFLWHLPYSSILYKVMLCALDFCWQSIQGLVFVKIIFVQFKAFDWFGVKTNGGGCGSSLSKFIKSRKIYIFVRSSAFAVKKNILRLASPVSTAAKEMIKLQGLLSPKLLEF